MTSTLMCRRRRLYNLRRGPSQLALMLFTRYLICVCTVCCRILYKSDGKSIDPAVYPYFDIYPVASTIKDLRHIPGTSSKPAKSTMPTQSSSLQYPYFDICKIHQISETLSLNYFLKDPAVYPFFDIYPSRTPAASESMGQAIEWRLTTKYPYFNIC